METTMNISISNLEKITRAARLSGISRSAMAIRLIKMVMADDPEPRQFGTLVRYQERNRKSEWNTAHLQVKEDDYEYLLDLRKFLKMSISLIIAYAIEKFLKTIITTKITDNNRYKNYLIIKEMVDGIVCWRLYWGYPPGIIKHIIYR
jgi:hypothetical protein